VHDVFALPPRRGRRHLQRESRWSPLHPLRANTPCTRRPAAWRPTEADSARAVTTGNLRSTEAAPRGDRAVSTARWELDPLYAGRPTWGLGDHLRDARGDMLFLMPDRGRVSSAPRPANPRRGLDLDPTRARPMQSLGHLANARVALGGWRTRLFQRALELDPRLCPPPGSGRAYHFASSGTDGRGRGAIEPPSNSIPCPSIPSTADMAQILILSRGGTRRAVGPVPKTLAQMNPSFAEARRVSHSAPFQRPPPRRGGAGTISRPPPILPDGGVGGSVGYAYAVPGPAPATRPPSCANWRRTARPARCHLYGRRGDPRGRRKGWRWPGSRNRCATTGDHDPSHRSPAGLLAGPASSRLPRRMGTAETISLRILRAPTRRGLLWGKLAARSYTAGRAGIDCRICEAGEVTRLLQRAQRATTSPRATA
jgi:hypothetical protein